MTIVVVVGQDHVERVLLLRGLARLLGSRGLLCLSAGAHLLFQLTAESGRDELELGREVWGMALDEQTIRMGREGGRTRCVRERDGSAGR